MSDSICTTCRYHKISREDFIPRCYSPQLQALSLAGIRAIFERADEPDPSRSHLDGTGACGPMALNHQPKEYL